MTGQERGVKKFPSQIGLFWVAKIYVSTDNRYRITINTRKENDMIHKTGSHSGLRRGVAMALIGAMVLGQPKVVEATRSVSEITNE